MTELQLNAEILRNMSIIAEDENLLKRAAKYLRKLVAEKEDPTLLTKEEFFARVDEAREQIKRGEGVEMLPDESLDEFLQRVG
jgi:predicted metal-dependent RNase